jgi:hypothetical protein
LSKASALLTLTIILKADTTGMLQGIDHCAVVNDRRHISTCLTCQAGTDVAAIDARRHASRGIPPSGLPR